MGFNYKNLNQFLFLLVGCPIFFVAQTDTAINQKRFLVSGLPVIFYTPETRLAFGATGLCMFNFKTDTFMAPRSNVSLSFVYTQNRQILLSLPYSLFLKNRQYLLYGELAYHRFNYNFYGVGNNEPMNYVERYGIQFPRLRVTFLSRIFRKFYAGGRYAFDDYSLYDLDVTGKLVLGTIPGSSGGRVSGFGLVFVLDERDNVYYPAKGLWSELVVFNDNKVTGSSFNYTRVALDLSKYLSYNEHVLALNLYTMYSPDDLPFFQMPMLGGIKKMRGFYEGRYRDNNALVLQAEYRKMVWGPLGIAVFGNLGQVARRYDLFNYQYWRLTYGAGLRLRFDEKQRINLRVDFAIGNGKLLPYFTVAEAF